MTPVPVIVEDFEASLTESLLLPALENAYAKAACSIKALVLTNPHNPLGRCYSKTVLEECLKFCTKHQLHLISDEVFALSTYESNENLVSSPFTSVLTLDAVKLGCDPSLAHVIWSTSKDFGLSGIRLVGFDPTFELQLPKD